MTDQLPSAIGTAFDFLDEWRHYPAYQLERRVDIFFAVYLRGFLENRLGVALKPTIIPEFPIRLPTEAIKNSKRVKSFMSSKVDFVLVTESKTTAYLVELKTDAASHDSEQEKLYRKTAGENFRDALQGVLEIARSENASKKYLSLLHKLMSVGLLAKTVGEKGKEKFDLHHSLPAEIVAHVVYIEPPAKKGRQLQEGFQSLSLSQFADYLHTLEARDTFAKMFAAKLDSWIKNPVRS